MLYDFDFYIPTHIHFGKTAMDHLPEELSKVGKNILLVYGGGSIKKIGLYDEVIRILKECDKNVYELSGVMPNPTWAKVEEGNRLVKEHNIDFILAVGGGSVIDLAKAVSGTAYCTDPDPFTKYWLEHQPLDNKCIPLGDILTMVGTGSESNSGSVITNEELGLKVARSFICPSFAILNPEFTYSVPPYQMKAGIFDIFSHLMEQYFSGTDDNVSDYLIEALMKSLIRNTPIAIANPCDYEARSNIMWDATLALNGLVDKSKTEDWEVHAIEHQLSAVTDCIHGMGLAAISVPYYKHIYKYGLPKFKRFATEVWKIPEEGSDEEIALKGLEALKQFISDSGMVLSIRDLGVENEDTIRLIANTSHEGGGYKFVDHEEIYKILLESYNLDY